MSVLKVPYYTQIATNECQSTCIKMLSEYLDEYLGNPIKNREIKKIFDKMKNDPNRPDHQYNYKSHENMRWWLNLEFNESEYGASRFDFGFITTGNSQNAVNKIKSRIDSKMPVMLSTNHTHSSGHVILCIGYNQVGHSGNLSSDYEFICHDPYGDVDSEVQKYWSLGRWDGGSSGSSGRGESGPGKNVKYNINGIKRVRNDKAGANQFWLHLITPSG